MTSLMTAGIPREMRRPAWTSLAAHLVLLSLLYVVPFMKMSPMGAPAIQVMLVSNDTAPPLSVASQSESKPIEEVRAPIPQPASAHHEAVAIAAISKPVRLVQKTPVAAPAAPPKPFPVVSLAQAPSHRIAPAAPSSVAAPSRMSDEINKLLSGAPVPSPQSSATTLAQTSQKSAVPHAVALGQCPPQARAYCPLLERVINGIWNADTDPGVRLVLESVGDATATIRMVILPDGTMTAVQVSVSSGNDAYDRAVQSLLRDIRRLPPLPADMQGEPFVVLTKFTYSRTWK